MELQSLCKFVLAKRNKMGIFARSIETASGQVILNEDASWLATLSRLNVTFDLVSLGAALKPRPVPRPDLNVIAIVDFAD
jgi:hypothetical protein